MIWINNVSFRDLESPRCGTSRRAMIGVRAALASALGGVLLAACGQSEKAPAPLPPAPPIAAKPDVIVTLDAAGRDCKVALYSEAQGSTISCDDVVPFVRDELRVPSGSIYDIRKSPDAGAAEVAKVEASLKGAGYRFIGGL
jgi:hypothetical protein